MGDNVDLEGGCGMGPSAALTPAIWDKTIPYNGETFHLEYMDLEEFLIENGIPTLSLDKKPTSTTTAPAAPISLLPVLELDQCEEEVVTITLNSADITANTGRLHCEIIRALCPNGLLVLLHRELP